MTIHVPIPEVLLAGTDLVAGRYRLEKVLGMGGMGYVVSASQVKPDRPLERVAIKFMLPDALKSASLHRRFVREAEAISRLRSEHVCRLLDSGRLPDGAPFMVMELLSGEDLERAVSMQGRLALWEAADYVLQILEAMAEAHSHGIIHRDLKPANVFRARVGDGTIPVIKVLDFGVAKAADGLYSTAAETMMGSPSYMAPEQIVSSKRVDGRADIYSIGAILYFLLTGRPPFSADQLPALCLKVLTEDPIPPSAVRPDLPAEVDPIVMTCMARDQGQRFANVAELASVLLPFAPERCKPLGDAVFRALAYTGRPRLRLLPGWMRSEKTVNDRPWRQDGDGFATQLVQFGSASQTRHRRVGRPYLWLGALLAIALGLGGALAVKRTRPARDDVDANPVRQAAQPASRMDAPVPTAAVPPEPAPATVPAPAPQPVPEKSQAVDVQPREPDRPLRSRKLPRRRATSERSPMPVQATPGSSLPAPHPADRPDAPPACDSDDPLCAFGTAR